MTVYRRCTRCVMDNASDSTITFDENGVCNYCSDVEKRKGEEYFPNEEGEQWWERAVAKIKSDCAKDEYDCIVGASGGIDSSYILYKGWQCGLRMLAIHIYDGLDDPIAIANLKKLSKATGTDMIFIQPERAEYSDVLYSLLKASVSNLAIAQDNLIVKGLQDYGDSHKIKYILDGANFAHESILERSENVNAFDREFILSTQKQFGRVPIQKLKFMTLSERYIFRHSVKKIQHLRPLNYMNYNTQKAIKELHAFCGFEYYGGKHYESILTRWMQCYYLPEKFGIDKRKSQFSSLIMSGQMSREEALQQLKLPAYNSESDMEADTKFLADYIEISVEELRRCVALPPRKMSDYKPFPFKWVGAYGKETETVYRVILG